MPQASIQDQVIALAGIAQAAALTHRIATQGDIGQDQAAFAGTVHSILMIDSKTAEEIFIDRHHLRLGLQVLQAAYEQDSREQSSILRLCASLLHLQKHLARRPDMLETVGKRIGQIQKQVDMAGSETHSTILASMAGLYSDTLSTLSFRIQVFGNPQLLEQPQIANQIRTCLLAGIRAVTLWRQLGGSRLDFIFRRKAIYDAAMALLRA